MDSSKMKNIDERCAACLELVCDPRSRLAAIRDPMLYLVHDMIRPHPAGITRSATPVPLFVFRYEGQTYYREAAGRYQGFYGQVVPAFHACSPSAEFDCRDRIVSYRAYSSRSERIVVGRIPDWVVALHLAQTGWGASEACRTWTCIDAAGRVRRFDPREFLPV